MPFENDLEMLDEYTNSKNKKDFDKLMTSLQEVHSGDSIEKVELILKQFAFDFTYEYNFMKLEPQFKKAENIVFTNGTQVQKIRFLTNLGIIKTQLSKHDEALECNTKALEFCTTSDSNRMLMGIHANIGTIYNFKKLYRNGLKHFIQAYIYSKKYNKNEARFIYRLLTNIGVTFMTLNDNNNAIYYFNIALDTIPNNNVCVPLPVIYNNLALAYINNSDFENAKICLDKYNSLTFDKPRHFDVTNNRILGLYYFKQRKYKEALEVFLSQIEEVKSNKDGKNQLEYYLDIARCYIKLNKPQEAKSYIDSIANIRGIDTNSKFIEINIEYYQSIQDYTTAFNYSQKYSKMLTQKVSELENSSVEDLTDMLKESQDNIAVSAYQEKLEELKYLNFELNGQKDLLLENLNTLKEEKSLRDKMISIITHDVRGPIGNASQLLNLFSTIESQEDKDEIIQSITESVQNTYKLTEDLVHWARDVVSGLEESLTIINISDCVEEIKELYNTQLSNKSILLINELTSDYFIKGEVMSIKTIFRNVIQNAIKYSHSNSTIVVSNEIDGDKVTFFIKDSGIGMSAEEVATLFNSANFSTLGTDLEKGTGLGMLLVKELVDKNFGSISCKSVLNKGTIIKITFPLVNVSDS